MGRVMALGGRAFIGTHQTYPCMTNLGFLAFLARPAGRPCSTATQAFASSRRRVAEAAAVVPHRWHPGANHGDVPGWQLSSVVVEKVAEPSIDWPVDLSELTETAYPA